MPLSSSTSTPSAMEPGFSFESADLAEQLRVGTVWISQQALVRALLNHFALFHDQDQVSISDRAQPVGHDHLGAAPPAEVVDQLLFGVRIQG